MIKHQHVTNRSLSLLYRRPTMQPVQCQRDDGQQPVWPLDTHWGSRTGMDPGHPLGVVNSLGAS